MIKTLFVLDIDDTLTKSEKQHQTAFVEAMKILGVTEIDQNWPNYQHMTDSFIFKENYERNHNLNFDMNLVEGFETEMTRVLTELNPVTEIKGAIEMVLEMQGNPEIGLCCATGSLEGPARLKLRQAGIPLNSRPLVGSNIRFTREEIVVSAIDRAKSYYQVADFQNIISVGDGIWDLRTARNLGLTFIGIGKKNQSDFMAENVSYFINDWKDFEMQEFLKRLQ